MNTLTILVAILGVDWLLCKVFPNPTVQKWINIIALVIIFIAVLFVRVNVGLR